MPARLSIRAPRGPLTEYDPQDDAVAGDGYEQHRAEHDAPGGLQLPGQLVRAFGGREQAFRDELSANDKTNK